MHTTTKIRLLIADDHEVFRMGLQKVFSDHPGYEVVGEASDGKDILGMLRTTQPDIILTDINMPALDGITLCGKVREQAPLVGVIGISKSNELYRVNKMIENGAKGYLLKSADRSEILFAVDAVFRKQTYFCQNTIAQIEKLQAHSNSRSNSYKALPTLTEIEIEIMKLICDEYSGVEIADKIHKSSRTVEGHRLNILKKLGLKNTAGIVKYAINSGIHS